jgi:excisionase family DNA binding protein
MQFHLLSPNESAALLGTSVGIILALIESGKLGAFHEGDDWRIPLQCLTLFAGEEIQVDPACALAELVKGPDDILHMISSDAEAVQRIDQGNFPPGSVGTCLKQALRMYRREHAGADYG